MRAFDLINAAVHERREFGLRFLTESIRSKFTSNGTVTVDAGKYGAMTVRRSEDDMQVIRNVLGHREYDISAMPHAEQLLTARYRQILDRGAIPVIIDAGANIGAASVWFSRLYPQARIVAIEPDAGNAAILRENAARRDNVEVLHAAIGSTAGHVTLQAGATSVGGMTSRAEDGIRVVTVDEALATVPNGELFIVKIDIEGFEDDLFSANNKWVAEAAAVVIEPHEWMLPGRRTSHTFQAALARFPFDLYIRGENLLYIRNG